MRLHVTAAVMLGALAWGQLALAQQYRSESRSVSQDDINEANKGFDAEAALQKVSDPYARTMLLAQMASEADGKGQSEKALKYLEQAIELDALSDFAKQQLLRDAGLVAARLGRDATVIRFLSKVRGVNDPVALRQLVAAYARSNRWKEAAGAVQRLLEKGKPTPEDQLLDATVAAANGDWSKVLQQSAKVLEGNPTQSSAWVLRIRAQLGLKRKEAALASRVAAWRLGVLVQPEQRMALISAFADAGVPLAAASLFEEGLNLGQIERKPEQLDQLAALWLRAREFRDGRAVLEERLMLAPSAEASLQLGQLALNDGDWDAAARHLQRGMGVNEAARRGAVAMMLGQAEFQRGRTAAAQAAFRRAATIRRYKSAAEQWLAYLESGEASASAVAGAGVSQQAAIRQLGGRIKGIRGAGANSGRQVRGFTDVGAEAPGNADGQIPDFDGGLPPGPVGENPFADETPVAIISSANLSDWAPWLSDGHRELLTQNPKFRMPVYPTHRSVTYPKEIREATQRNRGRAKLLGSDALSGARLGFPFPSPENGVEAMWNHRLRWRGEALTRTSRQSVVTPGGEIQGDLVQYEEMLARYASIKDPAELARENILLYYLTTFGRSARSPDFTVLVHESANSLERARSIWVLAKNYKKMFRLPPVGYDNPFPGSQGIFYVDMVDMYNGAFDHYDWKLAGKRELLIGYNAFKAQEYEAGPGEKGLLHAGAVNPDALRYEIHRVWVVEATERGGKSHIFGVRRFYLDEDSWNVVLVENFDRAGQLWRIQEGHLLPNTEIQASDAAPVVTYDLSDGRYFIQRMAAEFGPAATARESASIGDYRPNNVKNRFGR